MKLLASLIVLPVLMLVGCKGEERWISLDFSGPATHEGHVLPPASGRSHESQLASQFEKMGIPSDRLKIRRDTQDQSVVHIKFAQGALEAQQKEAIKSYLIGLIDARQRANFRMSLVTNKADTDELTRKLFVVGVHRSVTFDPSGFVSITLLNQQTLKPYQPDDDGEHVVCAITVRLLRLSLVSYSSIERIEGATFSNVRQPNVYGEVRSPWRSLSDPLMKMPALLSIEDADLRQLLNDGRLQIHFHLEPSRSYWGASVAPMYVTEKISFSLNSIDVPDTPNPMLRYSQLHRQCSREAETLGRPFSFYTGRGLDSLRNAVFWDEP